MLELFASTFCSSMSAVIEAQSWIRGEFNAVSLQTEAILIVLKLRTIHIRRKLRFHVLLKD
jgi:hypothetical protein